ncbi:MAG: long-chain fatty acid--CoA ligase, partial [Gemmatimonadaceae bacterium]
MEILEELGNRNAGNHEPFLIGPGGNLAFNDIRNAALRSDIDTASIRPGDVVALVGDFDGPTIATMLELLDRGVILMPLTEGTRADHDYFLEVGHVQWLIRDRSLSRFKPAVSADANSLIAELCGREHPGIIFFSSGTTGRPKAILHDF